MNPLNRELFLQTPPAVERNQFLEDVTLQAILERLVPRDMQKDMFNELTLFGDRVVGDLLKLHNTAMLPQNEPKLVQVNSWGHRVDEIQVHDAWFKIHDIACEEGIIYIGYDKEYRSKYKEFARVLQYVKLYLFSPSSAMVPCPLSMTDGAARLIEQLQLNGEPLCPLAKECFSHFITRDPKDFWTSGQWMTERTGGSDVSNTETIAICQENGEYKLFGYKFFTSATTSKVTFTLAKICDERGQVKQGSKGLSMFVLKLRNQDGKFNHLKVHKLKEKFGTKALPTAEIELCGATAYLVGKVGEGVKTIAYLFNVTRIHTMIGVVSAERRMLALMKDYASKRQVFGKLLKDQPLHLKTMADLEVVYQGSLQFVVDVSLLLGKSEILHDEKSEHLLRLLTPLGKMLTTKQSVGVLSEGMESFGGVGYMEDSGIPSIYRDAFVNTIWEGTTNVMAMDVFRAITKEPKSLELLFESIEEKISKASKDLTDSVAIIRDAMKSVKEFALKLLGNKIKDAELFARNFAMTLGRAYVGALLIQHAIWSKLDKDMYVALQWCTRERMNLLKDACDLEVIRKIALSSKL